MNSSISNSKNKTFKRYLTAYFILLGIAVATVVPNYFFLKNNGELLSLSSIVKIQVDSRSNLLYGTALHNDTLSYKQYLFDSQKPEVAAVGSSRVMLFRKEFFKKSFINMGGATNSVTQGIITATKMVNADENLKTVFIGVDFWWFNEKLEQTSQQAESQRITVRKLLLPTKWLYEGKISKKDYFNRINPFYNHDNKNHIGVVANNNGSGFGPDGSYFYGNLFIGKQYSKSRIDKFLKQAENGSGRFAYSNKMSQDRLDTFINMLKVFNSNEIRTIVFLTPVATSIANEMKIRQDKFNYVSEMRTAFEKNNVKFYDFLDPSFLGATDTEFYDGIHGSELTYARILNYMYEHECDLSNIIDINQVRRYLENPDLINTLPYKNKTVSTFD